MLLKYLHSTPMMFSIFAMLANKKTILSSSALAFGLLLCPQAHAQYSVTDATANFRTVMFGSNASFDPADDLQANGGGGASDLVGNAAHPLLFAGFNPGSAASNTDGTYFFRVRLNGATQQGTIQGQILIGIDAYNATSKTLTPDGKIDLFVGTNNSGSVSEVRFYFPGTSSNTSPSTTSTSTTFGAKGVAALTYAQSATNYNFSNVTAFGETAAFATSSSATTPDADYFLTFAVPYADIVSQFAVAGINGVTDTTGFSFIVATATQAGPINQDFGGVDKAGFTNTTSFSGISSAPISAVSYQVTPEPGSIILLLTTGIPVVGIFRRRSRNRA